MISDKQRENIVVSVDQWASRDAKWYQFWRPKSGIVGGLVFGTIVGAILMLLVNL